MFECSRRILSINLQYYKWAVKCLVVEIYVRILVRIILFYTVPKRLLILILLLLVCICGAAQEPIDDSFEGDLWQHDFFEDDAQQLEMDTQLFYVPVGDVASMFDDLTRYDLSFVSYRPKGLDNRFARLLLDNLELSGGISKYYDFGLASMLAAMTPDYSRVRSDDAAGFFSPLYSTLYSSAASVASHGHSAVITYSQRRYRTGFRLKSAAQLPHGWNYALSARLRVGDDSFVTGLYSHSAAISLALEKHFASAAALKFLFLTARNDYSSKGWVEPQIFTLTDNNLYNPYWGVVNGRVKSSRVNKEVIPIAMCSLEIPSEVVTYQISAAYRGGSQALSALQWFDAANPLPDYYMNLPSHESDPFRAADLKSAWLSGDTDFTQINWNRIYETNLISESGQARYVLGDKTRVWRDFTSAVSLDMVGSEHLRYGCGVRLRAQNNIYFRSLGDLLGGNYILNVDPYTGVLCDMEHPFRPVMQGDRYDYDYNMNLRSATLYGKAVMTSRRLQAVAGAELAFESYCRIGRYHRQGFDDNLSYGKSKTLSFTPFQIYTDVGYSFSVRHRVNVRAFMSEYTPHFENVFLLPDYANTTLVDATTIHAAGVQIDYSLPLTYWAKLEFSGYYSRFSHETQIVHYYDDIYSAYAIMAMENIAKSDWNIEAAVSIDLTERFGLKAAFSTSAYLYANDPDVSILDGNTLKPLMTGDVAHLKGHVHSPTPQSLLVVKAVLDAGRNWNITADWDWVGRRYVSLNPLRRTERVANAMLSPEVLLDCIRQERLPDASVFNIGVTKAFNWRGVRLFAAAHVYNLLDRDIIYGAYEQMRYDKITSSSATAYSPFPARYSYSYPRTFIVSLSVGF